MHIHSSMNPSSGNNVSVLLYVGLTVCVTFLITITVVLITLRDREHTTVPNVIGSEVSFALLALQERDLLPKVRVQYDSTESTKGSIIDQSPSAGANVRAGKEITLTISRGRTLFKLDSFIGKSIEEVHYTIQSIESNYDTNIQLGNVMYIESDQLAGVVIEQNPLPETDVGVFAQLDLVVSLGKQEPVGTVIPDLHDTHFENALEVLIKEEMQFYFQISDTSQSENAYKVASQTPLPGTILSDEYLVLAIHAPNAVSLGFSFDIYEYNVPAEYLENADPLLVRAILPNDQQRLLVEYPYSPDRVSVPYLLPIGSEIMLTSDLNILDTTVVE